MYILEESQLLEDTIRDPTVLSLYKILRDSELNCKCADLEKVLANEKVLALIKELDQLYKGCCKDDIVLSPDQKNAIFQRLTIDKNDAASLVLIVAATFTQLFVVENFTGPLHGDGCRILPAIYESLKADINFRSLTSDGNEVYHSVSSPWLLKFTQLCWSVLDKFGVSRKLLELEFLVWKHRYLTVHLSLLREPSEIILKDLKKIQEYIFDHYIINDTRENKTQLMRYNLVELCCELSQGALLRSNIASARKMFEYASELSDISIEHTGVLGKRTKFQQNDVPQLVVRVKKPSLDIEPRIKVNDSVTLPNDIDLDDDTLLPDVSFVIGSHKEDTEQTLCPEAQLLMLFKLDYLLKTEVMEASLKDEWILAYLRSIIKSATIWAVKYKALALRSVVEKKQMRKTDRALLQLEELIKISSQKSIYSSSTRLQSFYSVLPLSMWQMQQSLGDISFDLCLFKNALDVYTRIEHWEGIIKCYSALGETSKAEALIRRELEKQETPYLYCLLGDATENIEHYEKSWSLSGGRFARAKKSIGTFYYVRKEYDKAIENYEMASKASPSNISILSLLAYCYLHLELYEKAAECYRNLTYQDDSSYLAWNNLSKAYIKLNQKQRAWRTLREAVKCNYEEWKIWENLMIVSLEIGALDDVIMAWHRLMDIKNSHRDDQILSALTYSVIKRTYGSDLSDPDKILQDTLELLSRICATGPTHRAWVCYFRLLVRDYELTLKQNRTSMLDSHIDIKVNKMTKALQRATPNIILFEKNWYSAPEKVGDLLDDFQELIDCYQILLEQVGPMREVWSRWKSFKLVVRNSFTIIRRNYDQ